MLSEVINFRRYEKHVTHLRVGELKTCGALDVTLYNGRFLLEHLIFSNRFSCLQLKTRYCNVDFHSTWDLKMTQKMQSENFNNHRYHAWESALKIDTSDQFPILRCHVKECVTRFWLSKCNTPKIQINESLSSRPLDFET